MVLLIDGETHSGKTWLADQLLKTLPLSCLSLDHLKMGLIRGWPGCGFTALSEDAQIAEKLGGIVAGIVLTCLENRQQLGIEGCYFQLEWVSQQDPLRVVYLCLGFSDAYLSEMGDRIKKEENVVEKRRVQESLSFQKILLAQQRRREVCRRSGLAYMEVCRDFIQERQKQMEQIKTAVQAIQRLEQTMEKISSTPDQTVALAASQWLDGQLSSSRLPIILQQAAGSSFSLSIEGQQRLKLAQEAVAALKKTSAVRQTSD